MSPRIAVAYGASTFGPPRIETLEHAQSMLDVYASHHGETIDTSNIYTKGNSEIMLGKLDLKGASIDTKVGPTTESPHTPDKLREAVQHSAKVLSPHKINVLYLHAPDHTTPYEETAREINELHKQGLFKEWGLSNFASWEVAEIYNVCKLRGWVVPTVYQGRYNALERLPEQELFPCLRKYGIRFYAYSPLGGSVLAGRFLSEAELAAAPGSSRFNDSYSPYAFYLRGIYGPLLPIVKELHEKLAATSSNIPLSEAALRWLQHHSSLQPGDKVLLGSASPSQLEESLTACEGGPLPEDIATAFEEAWKKIKGLSQPYFA